MQIVFCLSKTLCLVVKVKWSQLIKRRKLVDYPLSGIYWKPNINKAVTKAAASIIKNLDVHHRKKKTHKNKKESFFG